MLKDDLYKRMRELDELVSDLYPLNEFICVIVGGGALLLKDVITRATVDVDVIEVSKEVEELFSVYDFNTKVKAVLDCFPYNYEDRLEIVDLDTSSIKYYVPCIEDLIVSKLYAYRKKDIEDLKDIIKHNKYNPILLDKVIVEAKSSAVTIRRYEEMLELYNRHFKE